MRITMTNETMQRLKRFNLSSNENLYLSERYKLFENHLHQTVSGEGMVGDSNYLLLWPKSDLEELNDAYEVQEFLSNVMLIGSDGGEIAYGIDITGRFVRVPFIGMADDQIRIIAEDFDGFVEYVSRVQ